MPLIGQRVGQGVNYILYAWIRAGASYEADLQGKGDEMDLPRMGAYL